MKKFEYKSIEYISNYHASNIMLNNYGKEGWALWLQKNHLNR